MVKGPAVAPHLARDHVQTYWDARPCIIGHSRKPFGSKDYFDEVERRNTLLSSTWREKKVLELSCGMRDERLSVDESGSRTAPPAGQTLHQKPT